MSNIFFSIIIPTFKRNKELLACLKKLDCQSYNERFQVIVINDDDANLLHIPYEFNKFELLIVNNEKNSGPAYSRNIGATYSTGEWLLFLDDDDEFSINKIEKINETININANVDVVFNAARIFLINESISYITTPKDIFNIKDLLVVNKFGGAPLLSIKKDKFIELNGFSVDLQALEDFDFNIKIALNGLNRVFLDDVLSYCYYSSTPGSVSKSVNKNINALELIIERNIFLYDEHCRKKAFSWIYASLAFKALLTKNRKEAFSLYVKSIYFDFSFKKVLMAIFSIISPEFLFKIRSKMG